MRLRMVVLALLLCFLFLSGCNYNISGLLGTTGNGCASRCGKENE
jgi:outer membrane lipopolysaccharide assembly protein LptE/RlpB